jgi:hypothetical protein
LRIQNLWNFVDQRCSFLPENHIFDHYFLDSDLSPRYSS